MAQHYENWFSLLMQPSSSEMSSPPHW